MLQTVVAGMALIPPQQKPKRLDAEATQLGNGASRSNWNNRGTGDSTGNDNGIGDCGVEGTANGTYHGKDICLHVTGCGSSSNYSGFVEPVGMITPLTIPTNGNEVETGADLSLPGLLNLPETQWPYSGVELSGPAVSDSEKKQEEVKGFMQEVDDVPGSMVSILSLRKTSPDKSNIGDDTMIDKPVMTNVVMKKCGLTRRNKIEKAKAPSTQSLRSPGIRGRCSGFSFPLDVSLFRDPVFLLIALVFAIGTPTVYGTWTYLPSLAQQRG